MAKNFLKKLTSKKKKSTSKSKKLDSSALAPTNPVPLPVIGRHRTTSGASQAKGKPVTLGGHRMPTTSQGTRSSITIGANRTPQPPPLTTLQKWSPGAKNGSPTPGPALIGRGRGKSEPKTSPEDEKSPYTASYSYGSLGANLFEDEKDSGTYNNYGMTFNPEKAPYTRDYGAPGTTSVPENAPYNVTELDVDDEAPKFRYGTTEDIAAILEAEEESDEEYDSEEEGDFLQDLDEGPEQKQEEVVPQAPRSTASKDTPAVRTHRAWLVAKLSKDYDHERTIQRSDLKGAAGELARNIKVWWDLIEELDLVVESEPDELETALEDAPKNHPIRDLTTVADAMEMAKKIHAMMLEHARRQELTVTEDGELGDISGRLVQYDDNAAQERSLVLVGGNKLFRNDDNKTPVDTVENSTFHSGLGAEIFVVGTGNEIHMASHKIGKFHHSSLLGGATVSMAGEMKVTDGKIDWVSNKSGHYTPTVVQFQQFLHHLGKDVPLTFPVQGWGVPKGLNAQQLVDGVNEDGKVKTKKSLDYQKTQEFLTAWKALVGKPAMKDVLSDHGWTLDKWDDEWEVEDADGNPVPPQSVRHALRDAFPDKKPIGET